MTNPENKSKNSPADRMRKIISSTPKEEGEGDAPLERLPRAKAAEYPEGLPSPLIRRRMGYGAGTLQFMPAFWTVASALSLFTNVCLAVILLGVLRGMGGLNFGSLGTGVLGGLYSNFERMDAAHIKTTIPVQTNIPLNLNVPVQTTTSITLAQDVLIKNAHVKITTDAFNIDSPADVVLPAGTSLNVNLNFNLPVQTQVPVTLNVPVDIPLSETELHPAISGLENTIRPWYCIVNPGAVSIDNSLVCR